jgi:hypothetical protein
MIDAKACREFANEQVARLIEECLGSNLESGRVSFQMDVAGMDKNAIEKAVKPYEAVGWRFTCTPRILRISCVNSLDGMDATD